MNILELCLSSGLGGLELYVYRSAHALSSKHKVIAVLRKDSKLDDYFQQHSSITCHYLNPGFTPVPLINARKLARVIDQNNIDVIHMHWGKDFALAAFAKAFSSRKPAIVYTRQMMITRSKNDFYHDFLYRQMDLMLTITKELELLARSFIQRYADKITTLYYGVSPPDDFPGQDSIRQQREALGFSADDFIVGLIGRLEESKGQHLLIDAVHKAKTNGINIKALIVGHEMLPGYCQKLTQQAIDQGVSDNIKFHDFVSKPQQLMQLCDCIALASAQETFGLVLPEAMRAGVAVIGSNSGGVPEIIKHEQTGLLFETQNADSLYQAIISLYNSPELKKTLAVNGKLEADTRFNQETHFDMLDQHLLKTVSDRQGAGKL